MSAEDDIDPLHAAGELEVYVEPVVAQNNYEVDTICWSLSSFTNFLGGLLGSRR